MVKSLQGYWRCSKKDGDATVRSSSSESFRMNARASVVLPHPTSPLSRITSPFSTVSDRILRGEDEVRGEEMEGMGCV
eukprot:755772-Hanusia_phi.AAC.1